MDKNNGKAGYCSALRTINVFEPLGKGHARTLWDRGSRNFFRDWAAGCAKHKSRITPILRRRVVKHRLCAAGVSHCDSFYDAANAFPSDNIAVLRICASDDVVFVRNGSGSVQGDTHAGEQFLEQYHPALDNSVQPMDWQFPSSALSALDPISGCNVSVSISTYADDLARATVCTSPDDLQAQLEAANVTYPRVPGTIGVPQMLKNKSMFHVLSASMPTITHAKFLKKIGFLERLVLLARRLLSKELLYTMPFLTRKFGVGFGLCRQVLSCVSDDFGIGRMWPNSKRSQSNLGHSIW